MFIVTLSQKLDGKISQIRLSDLEDRLKLARREVVGIEKERERHDKLRDLLKKRYDSLFVPYPVIGLAHLEQYHMPFSPVFCFFYLLLYRKSNELHCYVVSELIKNGVDQCNTAMSRLLKEKRTNKNKLTKAEKKEFRRKAIEWLDLRISALVDQVNGIDQSVTAILKEVEGLYQTSIESSSIAEGDNLTLAVKGRNSGKQQRKRKASEGNHPHTHRKRKPQPRQSLSNNKHKKQKGNSRKSGSTRVGSSADDDFNKDNSSDNDENNASLSNCNVDIEFIGGTDGHDDDHGPALLDTNSSWRSVPLTSYHSRERSKADQSPRFRNTQYFDMDKTESKKGARRRNHAGSTFNARKNNHQSRLEFETDGAKDGKRNQNSNVGALQSFRTGEKRSNGGQRRNGMPRSKDNTIGIDKRGLPESIIPDFLSNECSFESLLLHRKDIQNPQQQKSSLTTFSAPTSKPHDAHSTSSKPISKPSESAPSTNSLPSDDNRSLGELCQSLKEFYPSKLHLCQGIFPALLNSVLSMSNEEQKKGIVTAFRTLLTFLQNKCSTFLDMLQSDHQLACFHMDCWAVVFHFIQKKMHLKLTEEDGLVHTIFSKAAPLADHVLIMMIDVLYSQLLNDSWGRSQPISRKAFDCLCSLRNSVESVIPLIPKVPSLLIKIGRQNWHPSRIDKKVYFVSAIDPKIHVHFLSSGRNTYSPKGMLRTFIPLIINYFLSSLTYSQQELSVLIFTFYLGNSITMVTTMLCSP